jgi:hypothetical protein
LGRGGGFWEPLSLSLSPLARGEGIPISSFAKNLPKTEMRPPSGAVSLQVNDGNKFKLRQERHISPLTGLNIFFSGD